MSANPPADAVADPLAIIDPIPAVMPVDVELIHKNWYWFLTLGVIQILVGTAAVMLAVLATIASVMVLGMLALIGGAVQLASAIWSRGWNGAFQHVMLGVLYLVFGLIVVTRPVLTAEVMTLVLGILFLVGGAFRLGLAVTSRFHHWGWAAFSGVVTLLLGGLILSGFPGTSFWVIGTFVGIELLFTGWTWVMLSLALKNVNPATRPAV